MKLSKKTIEIRTDNGIKIYREMINNLGIRFVAYTGKIKYRPALKDYGYYPAFSVISHGKFMMIAAANIIKRLEKKHPELIQ